MRKTILTSVVASIFICALFLSLFTLWNVKNKSVSIHHVNETPSSSAVYTKDKEGNIVALDFTKTAKVVIDAVVHITSTQNPNSRKDRDSSPGYRNPFEDFFGPNFRFDGPGFQMPKVGSGSGVIIAENGYIVTNNHVIADADDIEVTLSDNRTFKALVIGTDPSTDLALIQIEESGLPFLSFVNSDKVEIGEWVLAVGNPFNLTSTVTAGIVSAKSRNINILRDRFAIESFIQTDAAINPGNSGGALVDLNGGLIGINTAIASQTGSYAGYGFAVPSNIVNKIVEDFLTYGSVQRGVLGVMIRSVDGNFADEKGLQVTEGAYVDSLIENSAALMAGIKAGDVIVKVNDTDIHSSPELQEEIAKYRPGETVTVVLDRFGKSKTIDVKLKSREGEIAAIPRENHAIFNTLGADFETVSKEEAKKLGIDGGIQVERLYAGALRNQTGIEEGFIITEVNGKKMKDVDALKNYLENASGGVMLQGIYPADPDDVVYYAFGL